MPDNDLLTGLDREFYRFNEVDYEGQKKIYSFYLPFFEGRGEIVDLACGPGDFPIYIAESGKSCMGVDSDPKMCEDARARGVNVQCGDVLDFLRAQPEGRFDGVFSGHLVEHLPFEAVFELVRESYRVLKPGGVVVLTTPNVRGLYAHLEGFYMHFGHTRFYHPRLLEFFLQQAGFKDTVSGENELMRGFVLRDQAALLGSLEGRAMPTPFTRQGPSTSLIPGSSLVDIVRGKHGLDGRREGMGPVKKLKWRLRLGLASLMSPFFEEIMAYLRQ